MNKILCALIALALVGCGRPKETETHSHEWGMWQAHTNGSGWWQQVRSCTNCGYTVKTSIGSY